MDAYEETLRKLYQTPLEKFVAARKRLADERRAAGDTEAARRLAKLRRPTASAWAVNQLYRRARDAFDDMLEAAARLRRGETDAVGEYREALGKLRDGAAAILKGAGRGMPDATMRRVTATLGAIAAAGSFDPDPPGALAEDRDPPGFDALEAAASRVGGSAPARSSDARPRRQAGRGVDRDEIAGARARAAEKAKRERAAERAEKRRQDAERARRASERRRVARSLRTARTDAGRRERALTERRKALHAAEKAFEDARSAVEDFERKLRQLDDVT